MLQRKIFSSPELVFPLHVGGLLERNLSIIKIGPKTGPTAKVNVKSKWPLKNEIPWHCGLLYLMDANAASVVEQMTITCGLVDGTMQMTV